MTTVANLDPVIASALESIASNGATSAMQAASDYWRIHKFSTAEFTPDDWKAAVDCVKKHIRLAMPDAIKDMRDALAANMKEAAGHTFLASMRLAGIAAAKEVAGH